MKQLESATLEDIELLILGGAWKELSSEMQQHLRLEVQDRLWSYRGTVAERILASRILKEHDDRYHQQHCLM